jgi:hypothetical protein
MAYMGAIRPLRHRCNCGNLLLAGGEDYARLWAFVFTIAGVVVLLSAIGREIKHRPGGIVIDNRNRVSLSKLQATCWTVLIMSGLITIAAIRMHRGDGTPLNIDIGPDLLIVMGISAASMVAAPAILSLKADSPADAGDLAAAADIGNVAAEGRIHARPSPDEASWADIFRGDEVSNATSPDLGKIQQFLITGLLLVFYAILLGRMCWLGSFTNPVKLPPFDESMVWLLGISHAGYLGYKAVPHSGSSSLSAVAEEVG